MGLPPWSDTHPTTLGLTETQNPTHTTGASTGGNLFSNYLVRAMRAIYPCVKCLHMQVPCQNESIQDRIKKSLVDNVVSFLRDRGRRKTVPSTESAQQKNSASRITNKFTRSNKGSLPERWKEEKGQKRGGQVPEKKENGEERKKAPEEGAGRPGIKATSTTPTLEGSPTRRQGSHGRGTASGHRSAEGPAG